MGIGLGVSAPMDRRMGGMTTREMGPQAPMTTDQKNEGRSRAAQRQYRRGDAQKRGAMGPVADMLRFWLEKGVSYLSILKEIRAWHTQLTVLSCPTSGGS